MSKVAIILPSRGLVFSRSAEEIHRNAQSINSKFFFAHKKPIPECFNEPTERALADDTITHLLFVEDDMVIPDGTFWGMLDLNLPVVACDYPVTKDGKGAVFYDPDGNAVFSGTGCLLVRREVLDAMPKPIFRTDIKYTPLNYGNTVKFVAKRSVDEGYGLHDVAFGIDLYKRGIPIYVYGNLGQRKLRKLGKSGSNNGAHKIDTWKRIKKDYALKKILAQPLATGAKGSLVTIETPTGAIQATKSHAKSLIDQGLATPIENKRVIIDETEVSHEG